MILISFNNSFALKLKGWSTKSVTSIMSLFSTLFFTLFLSSIFFSLFKSSSFLLSSINPLLNVLPNGEYSNFACSTVLSFKPKSSRVKYSYFLNY